MSAQLPDYTRTHVNRDLTASNFDALLEHLRMDQADDTNLESEDLPSNFTLAQRDFAAAPKACFAAVVVESTDHIDRIYEVTAHATYQQALESFVLAGMKPHLVVDLVSGAMHPVEVREYQLGPAFSTL